MGVRRCLAWPDPRLRRPAEAISEITEDIHALWIDMIDTMEAMPGVGLAAPQIGKMLRLAVIDASEARGQAICMANPQVLHASVELRSHEEASPNLPGVSAKIKRPRAITARFLDSQGALQIKDFVGLWAISLQHQIDHLNGKMYFDHLSKTRRDMLLRKARKLS
ncbi:MAG: peptide deformylase [Rhodobacteraceae bacterium]|jgi:peptide deformylase|nr:peptide deformylase [Paracoccaceae bacterium]MBL6639811.1 peptide deformylase [Paracoccaceae bacterium]MBL6676664.1 peptide deformylase [Paracoccaceae bacterium]MBL6788906.1 peptide deformylase [Paracoccaceae bacterium]MBL6859341.1 peptide deformylase [Paracoccaceae bacterium]